MPERIWVSFMEYIDYNCPYCGAQIELDPAETEWYCAYCESRIIPEGEVLQKIRYERKRGGFAGESAPEPDRWEIPPRQDPRRDGYYDLPQRSYRAELAYVSPKSRLVALLLAIFLGGLGIHRFYCGKIGTGILYIFTGGLCGIGTLVDIIMIACGKFTDSNGLFLTNWDA